MQTAAKHGDPHLALIRGVPALEHAARTGEQIYRRRHLREGEPIDLSEAFRLARQDVEQLYAFVPY